jgi:AcrR family transcriptional regulator
MSGKSINSALRRAPTQTRSKAKVRSILAAADRLLAERGYKAVVQSPVSLIELSGVTTGAFYNYFDNGEAVLEALSISYFSEAVAVAERLAAKDYSDWKAAIDAVIDSFADFYRRPSVRELWLNDLLMGATRLRGGEANQLIHETLIKLIERSSEDTIRFTPVGATVAAELGDRLLRFAFERMDEGDPLLIAEAKVAMKSYCANFAKVRN